MKKVYIIRHAKSSWHDENLDDFDRPLNKRGFKDAPFMGQLLRDKGVIPDLILSSPALRAKTTAELIANEMEEKVLLKYDKEIYEADAGTLLHILKHIDEKKQTVFLIGHNPGLNMLVEYLSGFNENIPTCGIIELELTCKKFREISPECIKLLSFEFPKKYRA